MANPSLIFKNVDPTTWDNPPAGKTYIGTNAAGQIVTKITDGSPVVIGAGGQPSFHAQSSASGPVTIVPINAQHLEVVTLTGIARAVPVLLGSSGRTDGDRLIILFVVPATAGLEVQVITGVTQVTDWTTDGGVLRARFDYYFQSGAWQPLSEAIPAFTPLT